jgi:hypothetical protein
MSVDRPAILIQHIFILVTYHLRFIPEGAADASQIFFRDTHILPKLVRYEELQT